MKTSRSMPWLALLGTWSLAFALFCQLDLRLETELSRGQGSFLDWMFSASRTAFGQDFYLQADDVFHKGARIFRATSFADDPFRKWMDAVVPEGDRHTDGQSVAEIMPYLKFTMQLDPTNQEAFLVAAYWLQAMGEMTRAEEVLRDGLMQAPGNPSLLLEKGKLHLRQNDCARAARVLDAALASWPGSADPGSDQARLDRGEMLTYRALLHELNGNLAMAADMLQQELRLFPERTALPARIASLRAGQPGHSPVLQRLQKALAKRPDHMGRRIPSSRLPEEGPSSDHDCAGDEEHEHTH